MMNDNFCSDIVALFWNHLWECEDCFEKVFVFLLVIFVFIAFLLALISIFCFFVDKLFLKIFDRVNYRKKYKELEFNFEKLNDSYSELLADYYDLMDICF